MGFANDWKAKLVVPATGDHTNQLFRKNMELLGDLIEATYGATGVPNWVTFSPQYSGLTTPGTGQSMWRRVGQSIEANGSFAATSTLDGLCIHLPPGLAVAPDFFNTGQLPSVGRATFGKADGTLLTTELYVKISDPHSVYVADGADPGGSLVYQHAFGDTYLGATADVLLNYHYSVPIVDYI